MRFRFHKSTLSDSLATTIEVKNKKELYKVLKKDLAHWDIKFDIQDIECTEYCYDERCDWNTYLVSIKNYGVIGMTDTNLESEGE